MSVHSVLMKEKTSIDHHKSSFSSINLSQNNRVGPCRLIFFCQSHSLPLSRVVFLPVLCPEGVTKGCNKEEENMITEAEAGENPDLGLNCKNALLRCFS